MTTSLLLALPIELLSSVAVSCDARSILRLSQVCQQLRSICYDVQVFRSRLEYTLRNWWQSGYDCFQAIERRAGTDVEAWARYAVADQLAWDSHVQEDLEGPDSTSCGQSAFNVAAWLPALAVVAHPAFEHNMALLNSSNLSEHARQFCGLVAVCGSRGQEKGKQGQPRHALLHYLVHSKYEPILPNLPAALQEFLQRSWIGQIAISPINDTYNLPLPFSTAVNWERTDSIKAREALLDAAFGEMKQTHGTSELLEELDPQQLETDVSSHDVISQVVAPQPFPDGAVSPAWDEWFMPHVRGLAVSPSFLSGALWTGIRTRGMDVQTVSGSDWYPPLENIRFGCRTDVSLMLRSLARSDPGITLFVPGHRILSEVFADDCHMGDKRFELHGAFYARDDGLIYLRAAMQFIDTGGPLDPYCTVELSLTPFGLSGVWGARQGLGLPLAQGEIWLWPQ